MIPIFCKSEFPFEKIKDEIKKTEIQVKNEA